MMKNLGLTLVGLLLTASVAQAQFQNLAYTCTSPNGLELEVYDKFPTRIGNALIVLTQADGEIENISGNLKPIEGQLFKNLKIDLWPYQGDNLTISIKPATCGRGSCRQIGVDQIFAKLVYKNETIYFNCF